MAIHRKSPPAGRTSPPFSRNLSKKYGPLMFMRLGSVPTLVVSSSQMAKEILTTHNLVFGKEGVAGMRSIWDKTLHGKVPVNVTTTISSIISGIMWGILAGTNSGGYCDLVGGGDELTVMIKEVTSMVRDFNVADFVPFGEWLDKVRGMKGRMTSAHDFFDRVVGKIIEQHVEQNEKVMDGVKEHVKDLVDVLLDIEKKDPLGESGIKVT